MYTGRQVVEYAVQIGAARPYILGAVGPSAYDCSGLVLAVFKHFGIATYPDIAHEAGAQARWLAIHGKQIPIPIAGTIPGAVLAIDRGPFGSGAGGNHIGFCRYPGISFEARSRSYGIGSWPLSDHSWTGGYLIPGIDYTEESEMAPTKLVRNSGTSEIAYFIDGRVVHAPAGELDMADIVELQDAGLIEDKWTELSDSAFKALPAGS